MDQYLKVFAAVAEKKNFSRAAEELHMTQPAVSQYIRTFEEMIGTRLLERTNKYVRLNKAGEIVYHHTREIMGLYERMQTLVDDLIHHAGGPLTIGASHTFGEYVLPWIIATLQKTYPDIEPEIIIGNTEEIASLVETHQLDAGIVEGKLLNRRLELDQFASDEMYAVASPAHPIFAGGDVSLDMLAGETWIAREPGSGTREAMEEMLASFHIKPGKVIQFGSNQPIKEAAEAGLGICLLSRWAIIKELKHGELKVIRVPGLPFKRNFSIITHSPFRTKSLEVFVDLLRHHEMLRNDYIGK